MNYRHAFHAGGFADVIKHIVLVRILTYLQEKPAAFRVIDTHAGAGLYDLTGEEARRGGEWLTGIARIMQARFSETTLPLLTPYLDIVRAFNPQARAQGLSGLAADRARAAAAAGPPDRLRGRAEGAQAPDRRAAPRHPGPRGRSRRLAGAAGLRAAEGAARPGADRSALRGRRTSSNGWPTASRQAFAKWPTGSYLLWYPVKSRRATDDLARHVARGGGREQAGRQMPAPGVQRRAADARTRARLGRAC